MNRGLALSDLIYIVVLANVLVEFQSRMWRSATSREYIGVFHSCIRSATFGVAISIGDTMKLLQNGKRAQGFAVMGVERQKMIASTGGKAAQESGRAHKFNAKEAAAAGRIGGRVVSRDRKHMASIGRIGGCKSTTRRLING